MTVVSKKEWRRLIDGNRNWLLRQSKTLERSHIYDCLQFLRDHMPKKAKCANLECLTPKQQDVAAGRSMSEFIDCPANDCDQQMRWDEDDQQYSCGSCARVLKLEDVNAGILHVPTDRSANNG